MKGAEVPVEAMGPLEGPGNAARVAAVEMHVSNAAKRDIGLQVSTLTQMYLSHLTALRLPKRRRQW